MENLLYLEFCDNQEAEFKSPKLALQCFDMNFTVHCQKDKPFSEQDMKNEIENDLKEFLKGLKTDKELYFGKDSLWFEFNIDNCEYALKNMDIVVSEIEYVSYSLSDEEFVKYMKNNDYFKNKKIVIPREIKNKNELAEIQSIYGEDINRCYFKLEGNETLVTYEETKQTFDIIDAIVDSIKKYNFSPLEQTIAAYDIVKERIYTKESATESYFLSRDLSKVLQQDKIVCVGYSTFLNALLNGLNIDAIAHKMWCSEKGHQISAVHLKDEKYDIDGVYFFDPTFDSKASENDSTYKYNYKHFLMLNKDLKHRYLNGDYKSNTDFEKFTRDFCDKLDEYGIHANMGLIFNIINFLGKNEDFSFIEMLNDKNKIYEYLALFENEVNVETFLKALVTVKKKLYYNNPNENGLECVDVVKAYIMSGFIAPELELMSDVFGFSEKKELKLRQSYANEIGHNEGLYKDIERTRLIRTLKNVCEKKKR